MARDGEVGGDGPEDSVLVGRPGVRLGAQARWQGRREVVAVACAE